MSFRHYQDGVQVNSLINDFVYDIETGRLDFVTETFYGFSFPGLPMNKYQYEWDILGRPLLMQKYQKMDTDPEWNWDLRYLYTYLPEDQSTYAQHLRYLETYYSMISTRYSCGSNPFLFDDVLILYSTEDGALWHDYYDNDYIYNPDLSLNKMNVICIFNGMYQISDETKFYYNNNLLVAEAFSEPSGNIMEPYARYLYEYTEIVDNDDQAAPPLISSFSLYPNPFSHSTTIEFNASKSGKTDVTVYNVKGQKVCSLLSSALEKGKHKLVWDGKDASSKSVSPGIYFIRLESAGETSMRKAILLK